MTKQAKNGVKSIETTLQVLNVLMELNGAGTTEIATELDMPKSTVHNYLSTLVQEELIVKEKSTYRIGIQFLELGAYARQQFKISEIAKPEIDKLAKSTGELANLMIEEHGKGSYLHRERGDNAVQVEAHVGTRVPLHSTGLGKAILAHLSEERREQILGDGPLKEYTENTITNKEQLKTEFEKIREQGYAFDNEERLPGLRCVAAPILSTNRRVLGAVSVSGPSNRVQKEYLKEELTQQVLEAVNVIELNVTYS
jgi:DNA-binding IclR family transcriptional regulator